MTGPLQWAGARSEATITEAFSLSQAQSSQQPWEVGTVSCIHFTDRHRRLGEDQVMLLKHWKAAYGRQTTDLDPGSLDLEPKPLMDGASYLAWDGDSPN